MADRVVVMSKGRAEQVGPPQDIYHRPANAFVADFIGRTNFWDARVEGGTLRMGDLRLTVSPAAEFMDGSAVRAAIRPEMTSFDQPMPEENRVPARVTFVRDIGSTRDIHIDTPFGPMVVEYALGESNALFKVGQEIDVHLPATAIKVFPAAAEAA